jgi:hypothetical protein
MPVQHANRYQAALNGLINQMITNGELTVAGGNALKDHPQLVNRPLQAAVGPLLDILSGPHAGRYKAHGFQAPADQSPLQRAASRFPLKEGGAAALAADQQLSLGALSEKAAMETIARKLDRPDFAAKYAANPPVDRAAHFMHGVIAEHFPSLPHAVRGTLVERYRNELGHASEQEIVRTLAVRLSIPQVAAGLGIDPLDRNDPRRNLGPVRSESAEAPEPAPTERQLYQESPL